MLKLTSLSSCAGCAAKLSQQALGGVLAGLSPVINRHVLVSWVCRAVQVIDGESQRLLRGRVAIDLDIAAMPAVCPSHLMRCEHSTPAGLLRKTRMAKVNCMTWNCSRQVLNLNYVLSCQSLKTRQNRRNFWKG